MTLEQQFMKIRRHKPVLLKETIQALPEVCSFILDGTLGHGGHTEAFIHHYEEQGKKMNVFGVDRDQAMIEKAKIFLDQSGSEIGIYQGSYADLGVISDLAGTSTFEFMLLDLGVNMDHFKEAERGFSIKLDGPLDMRFDVSTGIPVREWLKKTNFDQMNELFEKYTDFGQKYREGIIRDLLVARNKVPFDTTQDVRARAKKLGLNDKKLAVIFQARRIFINNELHELESFLEIFYKYLTPGGRCAIMTYHSGEDRIVKYSFKQLVDNGHGILYNKKVIVPSWKEVKINKASRSAKLRVLERI